MKKLQVGSENSKILTLAYAKQRVSNHHYLF
jgi:hypothetical protein